MKYVGENALKKWTSLVKSDIKKKLDKNQGTANSGKILGVDASGEVALTDTEVATLVDVPNGIVKGDGNTLSAAVAGTDYMVPPTGGTTGQILKKTETGTEWADAPQTATILKTTALLKGDGSGGVSAAVAGTDYVTPDGVNSAVAEAKPFIVTFMYIEGPHVNKTFAEIKAAHDAGRTCFLLAEGYLPLVSINDNMALFQIAALEDSPVTSGTILSVKVTNENNIIIDSFPCQKKIQASGLLKGNGNGGVSAAVAGTDYMAPVTGGTAGQILTKTTDGQEWQDREEDIFVVNMTTNDDSTIASSDKTFDEVQAAYNTGKTVIANIYSSQIGGYYILPSVAFQTDQGIGFTAVSGNSSVNVIMTPTNIGIQKKVLQNQIIATGLLKGNGNGSVTTAVAGTDYVTPSDMTSAIQSAIQNTWEASY